MESKQFCLGPNSNSHSITSISFRPRIQHCCKTTNNDTYYLFLISGVIPWNSFSRRDWVRKLKKNQNNRVVDNRQYINPQTFQKSGVPKICGLLIGVWSQRLLEFRRRSMFMFWLVCCCWSPGMLWLFFLYSEHVSAEWLNVNVPKWSEVVAILNYLLTIHPCAPYNLLHGFFHGGGAQFVQTHTQFGQNTAASFPARDVWSRVVCPMPPKVVLS